MAKDKLKTIAARSIEGFQKTDEYNTVLFSWYFKGFELLRRYLIKHPSGVDLQNLDLEVVDQEMAANKATQSSALEDPVVDQPDAQDTSTAVTGDDAATDPWAWHLWKNLFISLSFFFRSNFETIQSILKTMHVTQCLMGFLMWM